MRILVKRLFDKTIAAILIITLSPLIMIVFLLVFFFLGTPVIFTQKRPGYRGKVFSILKFRTMTNQCDEKGVLLTDACRITRLGLFLRRYSLDELPQLFNVLIGDLSLVGPRPLLMEYLPLYSTRQARRHDVWPGITGWAQVNGRNAITWEEKFELDVWYVENWSLLLDLEILWLTVWKVFNHEGISMQGQVTTEKFTGYVEKE